MEKPTSPDRNKPQEPATPAGGWTGGFMAAASTSALRVSFHRKMELMAGAVCKTVSGGLAAGLLAAGLLLAAGTAAAAPPPYDPNLVVLPEALVPSKVFDAKVDFGAVGNNSSDDTAKVQACIDAARNWGNGAIAYFPRGHYKVTSTINVTGGNYRIGGSSPIYTKIQGHGTVNPVVLVTDPVNIRVEFIDIRHTDQLKTAISQTSSGPTAPSRIHYDQVYLNAYGTSFVNASNFTGSTGMAFEAKNLSSNSVLTAYLINTQLKGTSFENSSDAHVLFSHIGSMGWGAFRVRGTQSARNGFLGILTGYHCYRIEDNHSLVVSDGYQEQMRPADTPDKKWIASPYMVLSGSAALPAGRVTVSSPKCDGAGAGSGLITSTTPPYETYITVDNYRGRLSHIASDYKNGSATFDPNKTAFKTVCTGTAPLDVLLMANTYEQGANACVPVIEGGSNVNRHLLANWNPGLETSANKRVPNVTNANTLDLAAQALDDFRELSGQDLLLNKNINSATFPPPTPEQAQTYPELPDLNWQKRSDWLDVKALPSSVNGGQSALGNGIADDTAAILAACNEVRKSSSPWSTVYLPPGTYRITSTLHPTQGLSTTADTHLYMRGHGKSTRIAWHGPENGRMFRSDTNVSSSFIGMVWDGRGVAAQGFIHDTSSGGRRETKVLHQYQAFLNFRQEGAGTASGKPDQKYLESSSYRNCIFINCGKGLSLMQANDYIFNVDDCQFYDNGVGIYMFQGEAFIRNCRFFRSSQFDIMNDNDAPNSSIRRCSSVGSGAFYRRRATTASISRCQNYTIQDCHISGWTNTAYAIQSTASGANSWDPMLIFDCTFVNGPSTNPPIRLDRAVQVVHSNNKWTVGGQVRTGAQVFGGNVANLQEIPYTPGASTYTVTFDAQGGTAPNPASKTVTYNSTYGTLATTTRAGHTFEGWWTGAGGTGSEVTAATQVTTESNHTLYAKWTLSATYTVTFDAQGGTAPNPESKIVTFGETYDALATTTRDDHLFAGWWTGAGGTGSEVTAATQVTTASNHTLYANWAPVSSGLIYWDNSGGTANHWGDAANWSAVVVGGSTPAAIPGTSEMATFSATPIQGTTQTVNLNGNRAVQGLNVLSGVSATTTLQGGGSNRTLTIGSSGIVNNASASLTIGSGTSGQQVAITFAGSQSIAANSSGGIAISNNVSGTGTPTLTNNGTGTGFINLSGALQATVGKLVQNSATSVLSPRGNNINFTGNIEVLKGTLLIGTSANNLGSGTSGQVILGGTGSDPATIEINDNGNITYNARPIVLGTSSGTLKIVLRDEGGASYTHTLTGGVTGANHLTIESRASGTEANSKNDKLTFTTGALNNAGTITHIGDSEGDLTINSVIGPNVTGVIQDSATSRLVLNGTNTYSGDTIVKAGTLAVNGNAIPDTGKLVIHEGGRVNLSGTTEIVGTLFFGGIQQAAGTWGATGSGAANINDTYFTGTGMVSVTSDSSTPYTYTVTYNANGATSGTAPASQTKTQDVDLTLATNNGNLARTGYTFAGWNTAADGGGTNYAAGSTYAGNADLSLFAKWTSAAAGGGEVTETFDTAATTAANGWTGSGNTANGNNFGWNSTDTVLGAGTGGAAGGIFARTSSFSHFADTSIVSLDRTNTLRLAGSFRLANTNFDGVFYLGYFTPGEGATNFVGIQIAEPAGAAGDPFRGFAQVNGTGGAGSGIINLPQNTTLSFDLTWTGSADGSGTLSGTLAGQGVNVPVADGTASFSAFGLLSGGSGSNASTLKTAGCYFDSLTYHKAGSAPPLDTYTVTYTPNGGTGSIAPATKTHDVNLILSDGSGFTRAGHAFAGWNTEADGSGTGYAAGEVYTGNEDVTLHASWTADTYTVTYDPNGGTGSIAPATKIHDVNLILSDGGGLSLSGFILAGWNTAADGSGADFGAGTPYTANEDLALYAKWRTEETYTVTYSGNGNTSGTAPADQTKIEDQSLQLASNSGNLARTGFVFAGWNTAADGSGANYAVGAPYTGNADLELHARWTPESHWNVNGGGWGTAGNWDPAAVPGGVDAVVNFTNNISENASINLNGNRTVGTINMGDPDGSHIFNLNNSSGNILTFEVSFGRAAWNLTSSHTGTSNVTIINSVCLNSDLVLANNSPTGGINFQVPVTESGGDRTLTLTGVGGTGLNTFTRSNSFSRLVVSDNMIFNNNYPAVRGGIVNDLAYGKLPAGFTADAITLAGGGGIRAGDNFNYHISANRGITLGAGGGRLLVLTTGRHFVVDSVIAGTAGGGLTVQGSGTVTLNAANTYDGPTTVTAGGGSGSLILGASGSISNSPLIDVQSGSTFDVSAVSGHTVGDGQTLMGGGTVTGDTVIAGTLAPGAGAGTLTFANDLTLGEFSHLDFELNPADTTPGSDINDLTVVNGDLVLEGQLNVTATSGDFLGLTSGTWRLFNYAGTLNDNGLTLDSLPALAPGYGWSLDTATANQVNLTITPPEPGPDGYPTWAALNNAGPNLNDDHDNDGVPNGIEYFLVGPNTNSTGFTALPGVTHTAGTFSVTWTKSAGYPGTYGDHFRVETSATLAGAWTTETLGGNVTITGNNVTFTFPAGPERKFARLVVTGP